MRRLFVLALMGIALLSCKEEGCTDMEALNYNDKADKDCCCEYPEPVHNNLQFKIAVLNPDGSLLQLNEKMQDLNGRDFQIEKLAFYLSNIRFVHFGDTTDIKEVVLLEYDNDTMSFGAVVEQGLYEELVLGIGLNEELNASDPNSFDFDHPLSQSKNTYWTWQQMYRFSMIEGRLDTNNSGNFNRTFSYHTGENQVYREVSILINHIITENDSEIYLSYSWEDLFLNGQNPIDLAVQPFCHMNNAQEDLYGHYFMDNFKFALSN